MDCRHDGLVDDLNGTVNSEAEWLDREAERWRLGLLDLWISEISAPSNSRVEREARPSSEGLGPVVRLNKRRPPTGG